MLLRNSFFNSFMKMKNEKRKLYFVFDFFYENEKRMRALKIQTKNSLNMKIVVPSFEVKTKSNKILNFVFQFIKNTKWNFGYKDWVTLLFPLVINHLLFNFFTNHGGTSVELITVTKTNLLYEFLDMIVRRQVMPHNYISIARKTLIFEYFSAKLCQMFFEINNLNPLNANFAK